MEFKPKLLLLVACFLGIANCDTSPEIVTNAGTVTGTRSSVTAAGSERKLDTFLGIPYAKPPVGNLRFAKPQPLDNFGKLEATKLGASCPQIAYPPMVEPVLMSEDCLFLNIFVPVGDAEPSGRAVMLFIHGGGYVTGSADMYVGNTLATFGDVIVVTINYRLGLWGFFSTGDANAPGNLALWDQHMALRWVNQNIGSFGGDNTRVTIFGESVGSTSVFLQALYPGNRGLLQRAIAESGTPSSAYGSYSRDVLGSAKVIAESMNCTTETTKLMVECLRGLKYNTLVDTLKLMMTDIEKMVHLMFLPGMDNDFIKIDLKDFVVKYATMEGIAEVDFYRSLDMMSGFNSMEGLLYGGMVVQQFEDFRPTRETMRSLVSAIFDLLLLGHKFPDVVLDLIMYEYTDWNDPENPEKIREQFLKVPGDLIMGIGSIEYIRAHSNTSADVSSYLYYFTPRPSNNLLPTPSWVNGANHGDELGFVFGMDERYLKETALSLNINSTAPKQWEHDLSSLVMSYWTNFAKTGNPNSPMSVEPEWPKYQLGNESYLEINKDTRYVRQYLRAGETYFWRNTVPAMEDAIKQSRGAAPPVTINSARSSDVRTYQSYMLGLFLLLIIFWG